MNNLRDHSGPQANQMIGDDWTAGEPDFARLIEARWECRLWRNAETFTDCPGQRLSAGLVSPDWWRLRRCGFRCLSPTIKLCTASRRFRSNRPTPKASAARATI